MGSKSGLDLEKNLKWVQSYFSQNLLWKSILDPCFPVMYSSECTGHYLFVVFFHWDAKPVDLDINNGSESL